MATAWAGAERLNENPGGYRSSISRDGIIIHRLLLLIKDVGASALMAPVPPLSASSHALPPYLS